MRNYTRNWIITFLCSGLCCLHYGMGRLSAQLFPATMMTYGVTRSQASFPFFLHFLSRSLSGPIVGYLRHKFDACHIVFIATVIASISVPTCFFAQNVEMISILWGGIFGFACGMGSSLFTEILERNWNKKSMAANGISVAGGSAGAIIFPVIVSKLLDNYGTQGSFLIIGGTMLNGIPIAMYLLFLDRDSQKFKRKNPTKIHINEQILENNNVDEKMKIKSKSNLDNIEREKNVIAVSFINLYQVNEFKNLAEVVENMDEKKFRSTEMEENVEINEYIDETVDRSYSSDVSTTHQPHQNINTNVAIQTICQRNDTKSISVEANIATNSFAVFCDIIFIFLLLTHGLQMAINTIMFTVIIDFCKDLRIDENDQLIILVVLPAADMIGRMFLGFVVDKTRLTAVQFTCIYSLIMALSLYLLTLTTDVFGISSCILIIGLCVGGFLATSSGVFSENLEESKLPMAYASRFFLFAPLSLAQSPIIGFFRSRLGTYNYVFYLCSIIQLINFIIVFLTALYSKYKKRPNK